MTRLRWLSPPMSRRMKVRFSRPAFAEPENILSRLAIRSSTGAHKVEARLTAPDRRPSSLSPTPRRRKEMYGSATGALSLVRLFRNYSQRNLHAARHGRRVMSCSPLRRFPDRRLERQAHIPRELDPSVLRDLGDERIDHRPAERFGVDGGEMGLGQHFPHDFSGRAGVDEVVDDQHSRAVAEL
jgi:hypothetical protein